MEERKAGHGFSRMMQGLAVGAVAMYMLDPDKGRRRRAIARDKLQRFGNDAIRLANQAARDASNRLEGVNARVHQRFAHADEGLDELRLIERVRAAMGRVVTHPHAVQVGARGRTIVLSGPILSQEIPDLLACVRSVPGVHEVENHLDTHEPGDRVPSLQGEGRRRGGSGGMQAWTPAGRFAMLVGGGAVVLYGLGKRSLMGLLLAGAGATLATRAVAAPDALHAGTGGLPEGSLAPLSDATRSMRTELGEDGTPTGAARVQPARDDREAERAVSGAGRDVPLLGDDGTPATAGAQTARAGAGTPDRRMSPPEPGLDQELLPPPGEPFNRPPM